MIEVRILDEKQSKRVRLARAQRLAELFEPKNQRLLEGLQSFLKAKEYEFLLMIKNTESKRDYARGQGDMAASMLSDIKEEVESALEQLKERKTEKEKS